MTKDEPERTWQGYLICEAALAAAEADCGLIPREAAEMIIRYADVEHLDLAYLRQQLKQTRHAMMPIIRALAKACPETAAGYVHWGATTQNIVQSADMLELRRFHRRLCSGWSAVLRQLAELADEHRSTVCAGRTHGQQAIPTTFGHLAATWATAGAHLGRDLLARGDSTIRVQLGGAVGTLASFGSRGLAIMERFAEHLALPPEPMPDRSLHVAVDSYGLLLGQLGTLAVQIATSLMLGMRTEQAELCEGFDRTVVGSSTMPQKVNPKDSQDVVQLGSQLAHNASMHLVHPAPWESGDRGVRNIVYGTLSTGQNLCLELLPRLQRLLGNLIVRPQVMLRNLEAAGFWLMSERVMLALAARHGRQVAHDRMHRLSAMAGECSLPEALRREFGDELEPSEIQRLCDPATYLGVDNDLIDRCLEDVRRTRQDLARCAGQPLAAPHPVITGRLRAFTTA